MEKNDSYNTHSACPKEQCRDESGSRRSSILKTPKPRKPLQILDSNESEISYGRTCNRRVSFHKKLKTMEFHTSEAPTVWSLTYEENFKSSSDSSHQTDYSSCPNSMTKSYDHVLGTKASAKFLEEKSVYPEDVELENNDHDLSTSDENDNFNIVDEHFLPLHNNELHPSIHMDFTEPFNSAPILSSMAKAQSHSSSNDNLHHTHYEITNSVLLKSVDHELIFTKNDADMSLTEALPDFRSLIRPQSSFSESNEVNPQITNKKTDNLTFVNDSSVLGKRDDNLHTLNQSDVSLTQSVGFSKDLAKHKEMLKNDVSLFPDDIFDCGDNESNENMEFTNAVLNTETIKNSVSMNVSQLESNEVKNLELEDQSMFNSHVSNGSINKQPRKIDISTKNNDALITQSVRAIESNIKNQQNLNGAKVNATLQIFRQSEESDEEIECIFKKQCLSKDNSILKGNELSSLFGKKKIDKNVTEYADISELELTCNKSNLMLNPSVTACDHDLNALKLPDTSDYVKLQKFKSTNFSEETLNKSGMDLTCDLGINTKIQNSELVKCVDKINYSISDNIKEKRIPGGADSNNLDITRLYNDISDRNVIPLKYDSKDMLCDDKVKNFELIKTDTTTETSDMQISVAIKEKGIPELVRVPDVSDISEFTCNVEGYNSKLLDTHIGKIQINQSINVGGTNVSRLLNGSGMELNECDNMKSIPSEVEQQETSVYGVEDMNLTADENKRMKEIFPSSLTDNNKPIFTKETHNIIPNVFESSNKLDLEVSMELTNAIRSKDVNKLNDSEIGNAEVEYNNSVSDEKLNTHLSYSPPASSTSTMCITNLLEVVAPLVIKDSSDTENISSVKPNPNSDEQSNSVLLNEIYDNSEKCYRNADCTKLYEESPDVCVSEKLNKYTDTHQDMKIYKEDPACKIKESCTVLENKRQLANSFTDSDDPRKTLIMKETHSEKTNLMKKHSVRTVNEIIDLQSTQSLINNTQNTNENLKERIEHVENSVNDRNLNTTNHISLIDEASASTSSGDTSTIKKSELLSKVCKSGGKTPLIRNHSDFTVLKSYIYLDKQNFREMPCAYTETALAAPEKMLKTQKENWDESCSSKSTSVEKTEVDSGILSENMSNNEGTLSDWVDSNKSKTSITGIKVVKENILKQGKENVCSSDDVNKSTKENLLIQCYSKIPLEYSSTKVSPNDHIKSSPVKTIELNSLKNVTEQTIMSPTKPTCSNIIDLEMNHVVPTSERELYSAESQNYMGLDICEYNKHYETVETEQLDNVSLVHSSSSNGVNNSHDELYEDVVEYVQEADKNIREISNIVSVANDPVLNLSVGKAERKEEIRDPITRIETDTNELVAQRESNVVFTKKNSEIKYDLSATQEIDNQNRDVIVNPPVEEYIKALQLRSDGEWIIKEQSERLWSYLFLYESLELVIKFDAIDDILTTRSVTDIQLISYATDKADPLVKFVHNILLHDVQVEALQLKCQIKEHVPEVLSIVLSHINKVKIFMRDFIQLERLEMAQLKDNCVVFDVAEMDLHLWFRVKVKLNHWDNISPNDVSVRNIVGEARGDEVKHLVKAAVRGPGCLLHFVKIIKEYIDVLRKSYLT